MREDPAAQTTLAGEGSGPGPGGLSASSLLTPPSSPSSGRAEVPASGCLLPLGLCTCRSPASSTLPTCPDGLAKGYLRRDAPSDPLDTLSPSWDVFHWFVLGFDLLLLFFKPVPSSHFRSTASDISGGEVRTHQHLKDPQ